MKMRWSGWALATCCMAALAVGGTAQAKPQQRVLYSFKGGSDGKYPGSRLVMDQAGNLYGANILTVFMVSAAGKETVLHRFNGGADGTSPNGVIRDDEGYIYGTTRNGGASGYGVAYQLAPDGTLKILHAFYGGSDGAHPISELLRDGSGDLYGTTNRGGAHDFGVVFKITPGGTETVIHTFSGADDGGNPVAGLTMDSRGNLYGAAQIGAHQDGNVFEITSTGKEKALYNFNGKDGSHPWGTPVLDADGNLYGTTLGGGAHDHGEVFRLSPRGKLKTLYSFADTTDGGGLQGGITRDFAGNLYGTTYDGGAFGKGVVFKVSQTGKETVLHSFEGNDDGWFATAPPIVGPGNILYGTSNWGGGPCKGATSGCGTIYTIRH